MNEVKLKGRVLRVWERDRVTLVTLIIYDRTRRGEDGRRFAANFPQVAFVGSDRAQLKDIKAGDHVDIEGYVNVYAHRPNNGAIVYEQSIRGKKIEPSKTTLEEDFGASGLGSSYGECNQVLIEGEVFAARQYGRVVRLMVIPSHENQTVSISCFVRDPEAFMKEYRRGTIVCAKCDIRTNRREKEDGTVRFYENIVMQSLDKKA